MRIKVVAVGLWILFLTAVSMAQGPLIAPAYADQVGGVDETADAQARSAERAVDDSDDALQFGVDLSLQREHQHFDANDADLTTLALQPYLYYGNWQFVLDVPWQKAEGGYFVNNFPPRLLYACDRVGKLTAKQLVRHPKKAQLNAFCKDNDIGSNNIPDSVSGIGDIDVAARYGIALDDAATWLLSFGGEYKFANGDDSKNLGSGTRDTSFDIALGAAYGWLAASLTAGHTWVDGGEFSDRSNFAYGIADASLQPWPWLALGCNYDYQQSYIRGVDDMKKITAYVRLKPWRQFGIRIYASSYGDNDSYPDREYGLGLTWSPTFN